MQRRTYKRSTIFRVKKRAGGIWEWGENPHRQCALLPLRLPPREAPPQSSRSRWQPAVPIMCANHRHCIYPQVPHSGPNRRGTEELRQQQPYRRFSAGGLLLRRETRRFIRVRERPPGGYHEASPTSPCITGGSRQLAFPSLFRHGSRLYSQGPSRLCMADNIGPYKIGNVPEQQNMGLTQEDLTKFCKVLYIL
jgi:hypothetical protein